MLVAVPAIEHVNLLHTQAHQKLITRETENKRNSLYRPIATRETHSTGQLQQEKLTPQANCNKHQLPVTSHHAGSCYTPRLCCFLHTIPATILCVCMHLSGGVCIHAFAHNACTHMYTHACTHSLTHAGSCYTPPCRGSMHQVRCPHLCHHL